VEHLGATVFEPQTNSREGRPIAKFTTSGSHAASFDQ
jgi:hypothetical protein